MRKLCEFMRLIFGCLDLFDSSRCHAVPSRMRKRADKLKVIEAGSSVISFGVSKSDSKTREIDFRALKPYVVLFPPF